MKLIKKTKKYNHKRKKQSKKQKGGGPYPIFIAQGSSGCVFSPPLMCKENSCTSSSNDSRCKYGDNTISKLMTSDNAGKELKREILLENIGYDNEFNYHLRPPISCPLGIISDKIVKEDKTKIIRELMKCSLIQKKPKPEHLLLYENGGNDFFHSLYQSKSLHDLDPSFILGDNGLRNLLQGIIELNAMNLAHRDLKDDNIIVGMGGNKKFKMIDFELLSIIDENKPITIPETSTNDTQDVLDILFGPNSLCITDEDKAFKFFSFPRLHYSLSSFFLGCNFSTNPETNTDLLKDKIRQYVKKYMKEKYDNGDTSHIYNDMRPFYTFLGIWDENKLFDNMLGLYDIFNQPEYAEFHDSLKLHIAQNVDLYAFAVLLLKYANSLQSKIKDKVIKDDELKIYKDIPRNIYKFLKKTSILFPVPALLVTKRKIGDFFAKKTKIEMVSSFDLSTFTTEFDEFRKEILRNVGIERSRQRVFIL